MNHFKTKFKPIVILLTIVLLLVFISYQSASTAMIGTEKLLSTENNPGSGDCLRQLALRQEIRDALIAQGVGPQEALQRVASLTDQEIELIINNIDNLAVGKGVIIFSMIVVGVTLATILLFNFTPITEIFP